MLDVSRHIAEPQTAITRSIPAGVFFFGSLEPFSHVHRTNLCWGFQGPVFSQRRRGDHTPLGAALRVRSPPALARGLLRTHAIG